MKGSRLRKRQSGRVTAEDVARSLGVSQSTISRAFTATASISDKTRERVVSAALKLGYHPNIIARSLITRRTNIVAIVIGNLVDPFYTTLLQALTDRLQAASKQILLFCSQPGVEIDAILPTLLQYQVDGIIITSAAVSSDIARVCTKREIPVVMLNRYVPGLDIHAVLCDNVEGGRQMAQHFGERGHERVAFVAGQPDASTSLDRQQGFVLGLAQSGIYSCTIEQGGDFSYDAGYAAALRLMHAAPPQAVFFASDIMAFGGMDAFRSQGLRIPQDISVAGFNDVPTANWPTYSLTTIRHPYAAMAGEVIAVLGFDGKAPARKAAIRLVSGTLVIRSSTVGADAGSATPVTIAAP